MRQFKPPCSASGINVVADHEVNHSSETNLFDVCDIICISCILHLEMLQEIFSVILTLIQAGNVPYADSVAPDQ